MLIVPVLDRCVAANRGLLTHRNPRRGGIGTNRVAEEVRRSDAGHGHVQPVQDDVAADDRWVEPEACPRTVAQHDHGRRPRPVIVWLQQPSRGSLHPKHAEVVGGDELSGDRFGHAAAAAAQADRKGVRLKRRQVGKLGRVAAQVIEQGVGQEGPAGLQSRVHAAVVGVAQPIELLWALDRERPQQERVDQREDGGVGPQAEGQRQNADQREAGLVAAAAKGDAKIVTEPGHGSFDDSLIQSVGESRCQVPGAMCQGEMPGAMCQGEMPGAKGRCLVPCALCQGGAAC